MRFKFKTFFFLVLFPASLLALPVSSPDSKARPVKNCGHIASTDVEYSFCLDSSGNLVDLNLKVPHHQAGELNAINSQCQVVKEKPGGSEEWGLVLVETSGILKWSELLGCVGRAYDKKYVFFPLSATPNLQTTVRHSLANPINLQVVNFFARTPADFTDFYINKSGTTDTQQECYQNDQRQACQISMVSTLPKVRIWLQKAPVGTVVHEEIFESSATSPMKLKEAINQYLARVKTNDKYPYGIYLNFFVAPRQFFSFISAAKPGLTVEEHYTDTLNVDGSTRPELHVHYQDRKFTDSRKHHRTKLPREWLPWYSRLSTVHDDLPVTGSRYTYPLLDFFFYESDTNNKGMYFTRKLVDPFQLKAVLAHLRSNIFQPESRCFAEQVRLVRVTTAQNGMHVIEVAHQREDVDPKQEACAMGWINKSLKL